MRTRLPALLTGVLTILMVALSSCSGGDGGDPPMKPPPDVTVTVNPTHEDTTVTQATLFNDNTGSQLGTGETTLTRDEGTTLAIRVEADGFETTTELVSFNSDHTEVINLTAVSTVDTVAVTIDPMHEDTTVTTAELFNDDTSTKLGDGRTTLEREEGVNLSVRVEADGFNTATQSVSFASEHTEIIELSVPAPDSVSVTINPVHEDTTVTQATLFNDNTSSQLGTGETTLTRDEGTTLAIRVEADGFETTTELVSFNSDHTEVIQLTAVQSTEDITVTINPTHADTTVTGAELFNDNTGGQLGTGETALTREEGTTLAIRVEAEGFETETRSVSFNNDHTEEIELTLSEPPPETVTLTATAVDSASGDELSDAEIVVDGETIGTGSVEEEFSSESGQREVSAVLDGWRGDTASVSADEDHSVTLELVDLPACSDGIDNDGDGEIDEDDPGCSGPQDDNESHVLRTIASTIFSQSDTFFVSSVRGQRELVLDQSKDFHSSIKVASEIFVTAENKREADQAGEEFAMRLACGPDASNQDDVNTSNIAGDQGRDDWHDVGLSGVDKSFFSSGTNCAVSFVHGTKVRGEPAGDGNDDVVFFEAGGKSRGFVISWFYEPDKVPEE